MIAVALALAAGCGGDRMSPEQATELATPHLGRFETFDAWARRAVAAHPAFHNDAALEETVFAPLRREDDVLASWIAKDDRVELAYGESEAPPTGGAWTDLRTERLGPIEVTAAKLVPPGGARAGREAERAIVLRRTVASPDGARVTVILAIALDREGSASEP